MLAGAIIALIMASAASALTAGLVAACGPVDKPDQRRNHKAPTPTSGGLGIILGTAVGLVVFATRSNVLPPSGLAGFVALAAGLGLFGAVDDLLDLAARAKLAVQVVFALAFAALVARIDTLPLAPNLSISLWPVIAIMGTALWIVVLVNALNFMDGADGLAPGAAIIILFAQAAVAFGHHQPTLGMAALVCAFAGLGFLPWNLPGAKVFQGDTGALFCGLMIAGLAVLLTASSTDPTGKPGISPYFTVMASLPLLTDTLLTLLRRKLRGHILFEPHRDHVFQRWLAAHPGHGPLAVRFWGITSVYAAAGWAAEYVPAGYQALLLAAGIASSAVLWWVLDRQLGQEPLRSGG